MHNKVLRREKQVYPLLRKRRNILCKQSSAEEIRKERKRKGEINELKFFCVWYKHNIFHFIFTVLKFSLSFKFKSILT